ncbi:LPS translocon maturation chaperone LptM [Lysobacter rhizosphaerae]
MNRTLRIVFIAAALATLAGCGNKGPLVLPSAPPPTEPVTLPEPPAEAAPAEPAPDSVQPPPATPPAPETPEPPEIPPPPPAPGGDGNG